MADKIPSGRAYRLPPCPAYDVEATESWLADMAKEGLFLSADGFFAGIAAFDRRPPAEVRYRLAASPKNAGILDDNGGGPDSDALEINGHFGWEYVASRGQFHIYQAEDADVRELDTDPSVQALAIKQVEKRARSSAISSGIMAFVYPLIITKGGIFSAMLALGSIFVLSGVALLIWSFAATVAHTVHLSRLRRRLINEGGINHSKTWRKSAKRYKISRLAIIACAIVWIIFSFAKWGSAASGEGKIPLAELNRTVPFATMQDFAPNGKYSEKNYGFKSTASFDSDIIAPQIIRWSENAAVTLPDGAVLEGGLYIDYIETISPWVANRVAREALAMAKWKNIFSDNFEELPKPRINADFAAAYTDYTHFPSVIIQKGNKVIRAIFFQSTKVFSIDEWAAVLADSMG